MNDPYSVLGITRGATDREIKKAYREMSRKYHPDSYTDETEKKWAEEKFREVQEAYNQIVDERSGKLPVMEMPADMVLLRKVIRRKTST